MHPLAPLTESSVSNNTSQ